jgi:uncharacterized protein (TIGR01777 family)
MKIMVTGATGLIGRKLIHRLQVEGNEVFALARSPETLPELPELPEKNVFKWTDQDCPKSEILQGYDVVVHLAGEGIADQRWTNKRKKRLWDSRVLGTKNLVAGLSLLKAEQRPKLLISSSAIGFYKQSYEPQDESCDPGQGFLSDLCVEWENAAREAEKSQIPTLILRTGLVLANESGVLAKTGPAALGSGKQMMSWVHIEDMVRFILFAIHANELRGCFNLVAPNPVTNSHFTKTVAKYLGFPFTVKVPSIALKLALGEMSNLILASQNIHPTATLASGFKFKFEKLEDALKDLLGGRSLIDNYLSTKQFIPVNRKDVFKFFSEAENLEILTPPWLNFHIQKKSTDNTQKGTLIYYKLNIHGIPVRWKTLISEWNPEMSFIDNQLKGPYKKWHHVHTFEEVIGGTLISDEVTFQIPGWYLGKIALPLVRSDVIKIFKFRQNKIKELSQSGLLS